jgi:hypothetical protein
MNSGLDAVREHCHVKDEAPVSIDTTRSLTDSATCVGTKSTYPSPPTAAFATSRTLSARAEIPPRSEGVPVKMLQRGAAFCERCARGDRWRQEPDGKAELEHIRLEEGTQMRHSRGEISQGEVAVRCRITSR